MAAWEDYLCTKVRKGLLDIITLTKALNDLFSNI